MSYPLKSRVTIAAPRCAPSVARVVAPASVLARGRSLDADAPESSGLLPQPSTTACLAAVPGSHPGGVTLPHAAAPVQHQRKERADKLQAALPLRGDAVRQARACLSQETHLTLLFGYIDATICYSWSPLGGMDRIMACGV